MADIELVIKIDEHLYDSCKKEFDNLKENEYTDCYTYAIANGTPLSEHCESCAYKPTEGEDD